MGYSRYIGGGTTTSSGGLVHNVSNPDNNSFTWLSPDHIQIYLSTAGQSLSSFEAALNAGTVNLFNPSDGYVLAGTTLTFTGLAASSQYKFQIKRVTPKLTHFVDFTAGSPLTEADLDNSNKYALFRAQELEDEVSDKTISLAKMKSTANITGDFVDTTSAQTITNKNFPDSTSVFDGGSLSFSGD
jgi:hypothetical protein